MGNNTDQSNEKIDEQEIENILKLVEARSNKLKVKILLLLNIYNELSTSEIVKKVNKSKPTVLKHLDELYKLGEVKYTEQRSPGAFNKRIYSLTKRSWTIEGQKLRKLLYRQPEIAIKYSNYRLAELYQIKEIIDNMVIYRERLTKEVEKAIECNNASLIEDLLKGHLGQISMEFKSVKALMGIGDSDPRDFLELRLILPIRRLIEQVSNQDWIVDPDVWPHYAEESSNDDL